jgi:hypothetical protein
MDTNKHEALSWPTPRINTTVFARAARYVRSAPGRICSGELDVPFPFDVSTVKRCSEAKP